jgi:hypothetical protein
MSFDIIVTAYAHGEVALFDREIVMENFRAFIAKRGLEGWRLTSPDGPTAGSLDIDDDAEVGGFAVSRPPLGPAFLAALHEVLRRTPTVLFWPGRGPQPRCCVARAEVISELPPDMVESLGVPTVVGSGEEIGRCIGLSA